MSKKFKSQASSARAASATLGSSSFRFGTPSSGFQTTSSSLSYITEHPDLSPVSDPNVVVSLRSLGKKDSTTKAKALDELQEYVTSLPSAEAVDPGLLTAWVSLYPRTSIDNARRVRQLAHTLQGSLTALSGKRIAPHLSKVIGPWLSGAYDSDKSVAKAAQESISISFVAEERRRALWKVYKDALIEYAEDAVLVQTSKSLSDERSTSPDDAEAKLVRVVGNAMFMLGQVIKSNFSTKDAGESRADISESLRRMVTSKKLWQYAYHEDPSLRKAAFNLATICTDTMRADLDWTTISACFIGKALHSSQLGSSRQLCEAILALTTVRPEIWTSDYTSKTLASQRLFQYVRNGSQRGPAEFWTSLALLIKKLPLRVWRTHPVKDKVSLQDTTTLIDSLLAGITSTEEPRQNLETAWLAYVDVSFWALDMFLDDDAKVAVLNQNLVPVVDQYITPDSQKSSFKVPTSCDTKISSAILLNILHRGLHPLFETTWLRLCQHLADEMRLSLPESSKDFEKSQNGVISQSQRLFRLKAILLGSDLRSSERTSVVEVFQKSDEGLMPTATELLTSRNGKPYGAASVLESIVANSHSPLTQPLEDFLNSGALDLLDSPSATYLISIILRTRQPLGKYIAKLIAPGEAPYSVNALSHLLSQISEEDISTNSELQSFLLHKISSELEDASTQHMTRSALQNANIQSSDFQKSCCQRILDRLSPETDSASQVTTIRFLISLLPGPEAVSLLLFNGLRRNLLSKLLVLSDSEDPDIAELANSLVGKLKTLATKDSSTATSSANVIADQLSGSGTPLSIFVLIDLAKDTLQNLPHDKPDVATLLMPSAAQWTEALECHISGRRPLSLAITNSLQGVIFMIDQDRKRPSSSQTRDADEFSLLFRLVLYVTKMLLESDMTDRLAIDPLRILYHYYPLALQLVNEKLTMESANEIWHNPSSEVTEEASHVLSQGNSLIQKWIKDDNLANIWIDSLRSTTDLTPRSYIYGLAFTDVASRLIDERGPALILSSFDNELKLVPRAPEVVRSASLICACRDALIGSQQGHRLLNELIAAGTDLKVSHGSAWGMRPLVLLDLFLSGNPEPLDDIPSPRLAFFRQALFRLLADSADAIGYQTMALKLLDPVLSATQNDYGDHWERILEILVTLWKTGSDLNEDVPLLHASLRLYGRLRTLASAEDANEDLTDAWKAAKTPLEEGLLHCLENFKDLSTDMNQPRRITAELLRRQLSYVSIKPSTHLYAFLSSMDDAVRNAAYDLLHRSIPAEQEQMSLELALGAGTVHLPPELLSVLSEAAGTTTATTGPLQRQSYLLCWHLIFDHFILASYKLRELYATHIKEKEILAGLLDLICEICRMTSSRPLDASKTDIRTFELGSGETDEQEEQRLSMHLYYCSLLYLPSLTRGWFIEQKNRVKSPLDSWTRKYFTPTLMLAEMDTVTEWVANQPQDESDAPVNVKTSLNGSETVASIAIDPESPPISLAISLPSNYPLESPTVSSRTRVGVSEKNWQSWLRTFQIIIFSTGSIIEGLVAFRRNVQGALKGQSECAICYSIIGTDMQAPNKRCGTCRNTFHGVCLFRWFKSSNSSSCPLCRNNFNYA
ncbi:uncharacterized protein Z518_07100 [Rhinocladiella mackenziei CBS 650.93]|uniref:E3 ubiquitin-protein ligase listerin n=1 Tax=Rhinocladiella mackenziei CBS 650.93 TaxID=1442369 RepID=A0A0D2FND7_9EURO|nr:uncharacterized protein Z518_07100 [Rhinocladiella mackenziei CBS 650.93]KIX03547.1 hypothetical protein Z518_07100 [Rhinocladiella mackenziei CBS 650.93]